MALGGAQFLQQMHPVPLEIISYHCHQSAKKYLKAYWTVKGEAVIKTDDLCFLNKKCVSFDEDFIQIKTECNRLTNYDINVMYPNTFNLEITGIELALKDAQKIKQFVLTKIKEYKTIRNQSDQNHNET